MNQLYNLLAGCYSHHCTLINHHSLGHQDSTIIAAWYLLGVGVGNGEIKYVDVCGTVVGSESVVRVVIPKSYNIIIMTLYS